MSAPDDMGALVEGSWVIGADGTRRLLRCGQLWTIQELDASAAEVAGAPKGKTVLLQAFDGLERHPEQRWRFVRLWCDDVDAGKRFAGADEVDEIVSMELR